MVLCLFYTNKQVLHSYGFIGLQPQPILVSNKLKPNPNHLGYIIIIIIIITIMRICALLNSHSWVTHNSHITYNFKPRQVNSLEDILFAANRIIVSILVKNM